jgi:ribonuclease HI
MILEIYTDGSCSENPGPAGWGFVALDSTKAAVAPVEMFGPAMDINNKIVPATNQAMELMACFQGIKWAANRVKGLNGKDLEIKIYSDSAYLLNCLKDKWYIGWRTRMDSNGIWYTSKSEPVQNQWIWERIITYIEHLSKYGVRFDFIKVKGHSGDRYNELADQLANRGTHISKNELKQIVKIPTKNYLENL